MIWAGIVVEKSYANKDLPLDCVGGVVGALTSSLVGMNGCNDTKNKYNVISKHLYEIETKPISTYVLKQNNDR